MISLRHWIYLCLSVLLVRPYNLTDLVQQVTRESRIRFLEVETNEYLNGEGAPKKIKEREKGQLVGTGMQK